MISNPNVRIRKAGLEDAKAIAAVHASSWQVAYRGIINQEYLDGLNAEKRQSFAEKFILSNAGILLVAEQDGCVVGFSACGATQYCVEGYDCEIFAIYIDPNQYRHGIGELLIKQSAYELAQAGYCSLVVWVLKENNNARNFYIKMGGALLDEKPFKVGAKEYPVVSYGWTDINSLMS